jgi:FkbM family methyltransferase
MGRIYRTVNAWMVRWGGNPIVAAHMKDGTEILVDLRTQTDLDAYYRGEYDPVLLDSVKCLLDIDAIFLDIGANIGFYTISIGNFIRTKEGDGKIISFEPFEGNYTRLLENITRNHLDEMCRAEMHGLSNESADSQITLREDFLCGSGTGNASIPTNESFDQGFMKVPIKLTTLDAEWSGWNDSPRKIDMIKMDIEGHEDLCLQGGKQTIMENRPTILMEVNKPYYRARKALLDTVILSEIPERYLIFRRQGSRWERIRSLNVCDDIDNVFFIPEEKLDRAGFEMFL